MVLNHLQVAQLVQMAHWGALPCTVSAIASHANECQGHCVIIACMLNIVRQYVALHAQPLHHTCMLDVGFMETADPLPPPLFILAYAKGKLGIIKSLHSLAPCMNSSFIHSLIFRSLGQP